MPDPADTRRGSNNNLTVLDYPLNIGNQVANGEHYMMIDSFESLSASDIKLSILEVLKVEDLLIVPWTV